MGKIKDKKATYWLLFTRHTSDPDRDIVLQRKLKGEDAGEYIAAVTQGWVTHIGSEAFRAGYWDKVRVFTENEWAECMKENAGPF